MICGASRLAACYGFDRVVCCDVVAEAIHVGLECRFDESPEEKVVHEFAEPAGNVVGDGEFDDAAVVPIVEPNGTTVGESIHRFPLNDLIGDLADDSGVPAKLE